jgi:hypothetical protein
MHKEWTNILLLFLTLITGQSNELLILLSFSRSHLDRWYVRKK